MASHDRHGLPQVQAVPGRRITRDERWTIADPAAVTKLSNTAWGEQEIAEFWTRKGWRLTVREEQYLAEIAELERLGAVTRVTHWHTCPFPVVYQTLQRVSVLGTILERGHELVLDFDDDDDHLMIGEPRFPRTQDYTEDHVEGHGVASSATQ